MHAPEKVIIAGAGLTGSMLAILLARRGYTVELYEKRSDIAKSRPDAKRTIAMSISYRGWKALETFGLADQLRTLSTPSYGRITHHPGGERYKQFYGQEDESIDTIDRKALNCALIELATSFECCSIHYDAEVDYIDFDAKSIAIRVGRGSEESTFHSYDFLFATDGVFSTCRRAYERFEGLAPQIYKLPIGYKEFTIPYAIVESMELDRSFVHVWPGGSANFVALPSDAKQAFLGNLFCSNDWVDFFRRRPSKAEVVELLAPAFPLLGGVLGRLDESCFTEPSANIYTTASERWSHGDSFLMLGDAVHGMAPFYAMGMNTCFEDCDVFEALLNERGGDLHAALPAFQAVRKADVDAMQDISFENFRNLSQSSEIWFEREWRLDRMMSEFCPEDWLSESALISFRDVPISAVGAWVERQRHFISERSLSYEALRSMSPGEIEALRREVRELASLHLDKT